MTNWLFPLLALAIGLGFLLYPTFAYIKVERDSKYSFFNCFPCEMARNVNQKGVVICLAMLFVMLASEGYASNFAMVRRTSFYSSMVFEILSCLGFLGIVIFGLDHYKTHVIFDVIFFLAEIGGNINTFIGYLINMEEHIAFNYYISIVFGVLGGILIIILLLPQLKRWMFLEKSEENGKVVYVRPKVSSLALTEWIFFLAHLVNMILLIINAFTSF